MTWRQILEGLAALPTELRALRREGLVGVLSLSETDVIVIETDKDLHQVTRERLYQTCKDIWPKNRVVVCDGGIRVRAVSGSEQDDRVA